MIPHEKSILIQIQDILDFFKTKSWDTRYKMYDQKCIKIQKQNTSGKKYLIKDTRYLSCISNTCISNTTQVTDNHLTPFSLSCAGCQNWPRVFLLSPKRHTQAHCCAHVYLLPPILLSLCPVHGRPSVCLRFKIEIDAKPPSWHSCS